MVGRILPEHQELRVGMLVKKAQNKSYFFTANNYKERVFVLESQLLVYYSGSLQKRDDEKGRIELSSILAVETLLNKLSPNCGFQVSYEEDGRPLLLYVFAKNQEDRDVWIKAIREEATKNGAFFTQNYHPAIWDQSKGFTCCGAPSRGDEGCKPVTSPVTETRERLLSRASSANAGEVLVDMMSKRSQGKSTFFGAINYKERVFVLDTCSFRYFSGNLRNREEEKGSIELCSVLAVENIRDGLLENRKNAFQVVYEDDDDIKVTLVIVARTGDRRQMWVQAVRDEAKKNRAKFQSHYHTGIWIKNLGKYNCCEDTNRESVGCEPLTAHMATQYGVWAPVQTMSPHHTRQELLIRKIDPEGRSTRSAGNLNVEGTMPSQEVKVGLLTKRAQNKSWLYVSKSYKQRLFVLDHSTLIYFDGSLKRRGEKKGSIALNSMLVVATVDDGSLDGHRNAFQVVYKDADDGQLYLLYLVASRSAERQAWVNAIITEASKAGANLCRFHHGGVWNKRMGSFSCCGQKMRDAQGCVDNDPNLSALSPSPRPTSSSLSSSPSITV